VSVERKFHIMLLNSNHHLWIAHHLSQSLLVNLWFTLNMFESSGHAHGNQCFARIFNYVDAFLVILPVLLFECADSDVEKLIFFFLHFAADVCMH
jgi:hypothetical protein